MNTHLGGGSPSLLTGELQTKTTASRRFTPTGMATIKLQKRMSVGEDVEKLEPKWEPLTVHKGLSRTPHSITDQDIHSREWKRNVYTNLCADVHRSVI